MAADDILRAIAKSAGQADNVNLDALIRLAPKSSDWGWKGGKPGEITGTIYSLKKKTRDFEKATGDQYLKAVASGKLPEVSDVDLLMRDFKVLEDAGIPREWTGKVMKSLGGRIPYDGVSGVDTLLGGADPNYAYDLTRIADFAKPFKIRVARKISNLMEQMTNEQRKDFVQGLSGWEDSLDNLDFFVRNV